MLLSLFVLLILLGSHLLRVQQKQSDQRPFSETFNRKIEQLLEHFSIPGLAISVVQDDEILARGYGVSDIETSQAVSEHTLFFAGSTTKAFTAAAVSLLVDDNHHYPNIQWTTPVHSIIPEDFTMIDPWYTAHVTVTDMLSHRSGLPRHDWLLLTNLTQQEIVQRIRYLPLTAEIRTKFQYSNLMYITAAHMIESVSGHSLPSFLTERIWAPLNMSETYLSLTDAQRAGRNISQGYYLDINGKLVSTQHVSMRNSRGAGNILSSVADYAKWISTLLRRGPPLSEAGYRTLFGAHSIAAREPVPPFVSPTLYGMGWVVQTYRGETVIQHAGSQYGFGSLVALLPQRKLGVVVMGNNMRGTNAAADIIAFDIIDDVLDTPRDERFDWRGRADERLAADTLTNDTFRQLYPVLPDPPQPYPLNLSAYEGLYVHAVYPNLTISSDCSETAGGIFYENGTGAKLCAFLVEPGDYFPKPLLLEMYHVSGNSWVLVTTIAGAMSVARVEFRFDADGHRMSHMGAEVESAMARVGEKIWWAHV
ncbi:putative penicillin-binding protein [Aspergillus aculeatinus CBS 121060]|uniref:Penicillin-binding protein n=1 Tax=Aspergillus aculeatinus CBS 121060 TaxID=1448322 RepID=A0ACD1H9B4_9EURO|nr:putative penicillin-binding protein [Aspergillus aculeatinus CBS 121060]RAH69999.1 putative penicillin-binding protein [Aspergillus aculeatinus CBS 121060]